MGWMLKHQEEPEVHHIKSDVFVIGRDKQADLICRNILVSKYHSRITKEQDGTLAVIDLNSSNGTFVNCEKIRAHKKMVLKEGDLVSFGMLLGRQNDGLNVSKPHYVYKLCNVPDIIEILTSDEEFEDIPKKNRPEVQKLKEETTAPKSVNDEFLDLNSTQKKTQNIKDKPPARPCLDDRPGPSSNSSSGDTVGRSNDDNPETNDVNIQSEVKVVPPDLNNHRPKINEVVEALNLNGNDVPTKINILKHMQINEQTLMAQLNELTNLQKEINELKKLKENDLQNQRKETDVTETETNYEESNVENRRTLRSAVNKTKGVMNGLKQPMSELELITPTCSKTLEDNDAETGKKHVELQGDDVAMEISRVDDQNANEEAEKVVERVSPVGKIHIAKNLFTNPEAVLQNENSSGNQLEEEAEKVVEHVSPVGKIHIAKNLFTNTEAVLQNGNSSGNQSEIKQPITTPQLKQEPGNLDYSQDDNLIVIRDDDEEEGDIFMFSQLYTKPEIKVEEIVEAEEPSPRNDYLNDDDKAILIDDNDDDLFSAVCSQMYIKEEGAENEGDQSKKTNGHSKLNEEEFMNIKREVAAMDKYDDPLKLPPVVIWDTMDYSDSEDIFDLANKEIAAEASTSKKDDASVPKSYTKPPIVEPHQMKPVTRSKRQASTKLPEVIPAKKIKSPKKGKKGKGNKGKQSPVKKPPPQAKELQEARRQKLKEIAAKAAPKSKEKPEVQTRITTAKHTKTSTGRGGFLLPAEDAPGTSKRVTIAERHEQIKSLTHNLPKSRFIDEYRDVVRSIIMWNQKWINEQHGKDMLPPVAGKEVIKMCDSFSSHKDYYTVLQPLIITELWFNFCKEYEGSSFSKQINSSGNHIAKITSVKINDFYTEITCNSYLNKKSNDCGDHLQVKNIVLLNAYFGSERNSCKTFFGLVVWFNKEPLKLDANTDKKMIQACGSLPTTKLSFVLVVKKFSEIINQEYHINIRYFTFLPQYLRLISSVKALGTSPLLNHVIDPKYSDYVIKGGRRRQLLGEKYLNQSQTEALYDVFNLHESQKSGLYLIEGPPGTGKSTVIINIILEFLLNQDVINGCLLLLAPSNGAIDSIINKIMFVIKPNLKEGDRQKVKLVRVGNVNAIDRNIFKYSLDELAKSNVQRNFMNEHPQTQRDYERLGQQLQELKDKFSENPNDPLLIRDIDKKNMERSNFAQTYLKSKYRTKLDEQRVIVLNHANIICSTIMSSPKILLKGFDVDKIKMCIIDEASQCSEPETLVPVGLGINKIVLVGDPQQLPAISSSILVKKYGYCRSLFSRIKLNLSREKVNPIKMLNVQYRMHPEICHFPNNEYYGGKLRTEFSYKKRALEVLKPYLVFSQSFMNTKVYENLKEIELLMLLIKAIVKAVGVECTFSIGIITPYSVQKKSINTELEKLSLSENITVTCNTVDSFQGQEKDVILLSCVRNTPNSFLSDEQRINVSITRAKCALYIIGTETLLKNCSVLKKISSDAQKRNLYHKLSTNMTETNFRNLIVNKKK